MDSKLEAVLSELATKLGTSVEHLYELTIKQAKIEVVGKVIHGILFVLFIIFLIITTVYLSDKKWESGGQYSIVTGLGFCMMITGLIDAIVIVVLVVELGNYCKNLATLITNPEYWAIQDILASIKE